MAFITWDKRKKLYAVLAALLAIILLFLILAIALPDWSVNRRSNPQTHTGLFAACTDPIGGNDGWIGQTCVSVKKVAQCDGWLQSARVFAILSIVLTVFCIILTLACAFQTTVKKILPMILCGLLFLLWFFLMMVIISWAVFREPKCSNTDGQELGASYCLAVFAFIFALFAFCLAAYLLIAKPTDNNGFPTEMKDIPPYQASVQGGYPYQMDYPGGPFPPSYPGTGTPQYY